MGMIKGARVSDRSSAARVRVTVPAKSSPRTPSELTLRPAATNVRSRAMTRTRHSKPDSRRSAGCRTAQRRPAPISVMVAARQRSRGDTMLPINQATSPTIARTTGPTTAIQIRSLLPAARRLRSSPHITRPGVTKRAMTPVNVRPRVTVGGMLQPGESMLTRARTRTMSQIRCGVIADAALHALAARIVSVSGGDACGTGLARGRICSWLVGARGAECAILTVPPRQRKTPTPSRAPRRSARRLIATPVGRCRAYRLSGMSVGRPHW